MQLWRTEVRNDSRQVGGRNLRRKSLTATADGRRTDFRQAKKKIRQKEVVHQQHDILKGRDIHLEGIKYKSKHAGSTRKNDGTPHTSKKCTCCGKTKHPRDKCPGRDAECFKCHKKGHYSSLCLSKKTSTAVSTVLGTEQTDASETESDDNFLGTVESQGKTQWMLALKVNNLDVTFKIDTGAEVSAINETTFNKLKDIQLKKPQKLLYGPAMSPLTVLGQFTASLTFNHVTYKQKVFVVKDQFVRVACDYIIKSNLKNEHSPLQYSRH